MAGSDYTLLNEMDGWIWRTTSFIFLFPVTQSSIPSSYWPRERQDENEVDVWLAVKKEEFKQALINLPSSPSSR